MTAAAGQVIATSTGNVPQQMLPGIVSTNANQVLIFGQCEAAATQESLNNTRPKVTTSIQNGKAHIFQNQLPVLQPNSLYGSLVPVNCSSQILNECHVRGIPSQPQIMNTQASGTMLNPSQLLGLQTINALSPGLSWVPTGLNLGQNPLIIYNQLPSMTIHRIRPQMTMHFPIAAATLPTQTRTAVSAPRRQIYPKLKPKVKTVTEPCVDQQKQLSIPAAGNQTALNQVNVTNNLTKSTGGEGKSLCIETEISSPPRSQSMDVPFSEIQQASVASISTGDVPVVDMTPSALITESCASENRSPSNTEIVTLNVEINQASTSVTLSDADIETYPNLKQADNDQTKSVEIESNTLSVETQISSPQGSQAMAVAFSEIQQASVASKPTGDVSVVDVTPSTLIMESCADENHSPSNTEIVTLNAEINQASTSVTLSDADVETYPNLKPAVNDQTKSVEIESNALSVETKILSPQKSQASITPSSKIPQVCFASTVNVSVVSMTSCTIGSSTDLNLSPSSIQSSIAHVKTNPVLALLNSNACNEICPNPIQSVNDLTNSTQNESKSVSDESSHLKSQAMASPSSQFLQKFVGPTPTVDVSTISTTPSDLMIVTSTESVMSTTSVSSVVSNLNVPTIVPVSLVSYLTDNVSNSKPSLNKAHNEAAVTSYQTNTADIMVTNEYLKPEELSLESVKENKSLTAKVRPRILTHVIDGLVFQESSEPFPVSQLPLLDSSSRVLLLKELNLPEEKRNSLTVPNPGNKVRALKSQKNIELAKCEFCGKLGHKFRFKRRKRFCSKSCAKEFNKHISKRVKKPVPTIQEHMVSGTHDYKRKGFKRRKYLPTKLLVDEDGSAVIEKILLASENESTAPCLTDEEMEIDKSTNEVGLLKSDLSQKLPSKWTVQDVFEFIQNLPGYSEYADNFKSQEIDGEALLLLNEDHLKTTIGMKFGPAIKLLSRIRSIEKKLQS